MVIAFVHDVDAYTARHIAKLLSETIVGSRKGTEGEGSDAEKVDGEETAPTAGVSAQKQSYEVIGTLSVPPESVSELTKAARELTIADPAFGIGQKPKWVKDVVQKDDREALKTALLNADVIVYDLLQNPEEATKAIELLDENRESFKTPKTFIGVSTVLTWSRTKINAEDPEAPFTEDEYRRRKPHPNFKTHITAEKTIIKLGKKGLLKTFVVCAGLTYGNGENIFHFLFKSAWQGDKELNCFGDGSNIVPTIHIQDLANIVVEVAEVQPEVRYLLAVDDSKSTLTDLVQNLSNKLGSGKVKKISKEDALLIKDLPQTNYDLLLVNLRMDAQHVKDMSFEWKSEAGPVENMGSVIKEYKDARGLQPLKIFIQGPPASGKSTVAKKLAEFYQVPLIEVEDVIKKTISRLEESAATKPPAESEEQDEAALAAQAAIEADKQLLDEVRETAKQNNGRYSEEQVQNFVRDMLKSRKCRNQGYVLDGYPKRAEEAKELFRPSGEDEAEEEGKAPDVDNALMPEHVLEFQASDNWVKAKVMNLSEAEVAGTKNAEEELVKRLDKYRELEKGENNVFNFFDERELHPTVIEAEKLSDEAIEEFLRKRIGKPHNYGPTQEELAGKIRKDEEERLRLESAEREERERREKEEAEEEARKIAEWNANILEARKQEQEVLEAQSVPLRNYLVKYVMPTLTSALIEVCKTRPEDPVDYVAEYLFKNNPSTQ